MLTPTQVQLLFGALQSSLALRIYQSSDLLEMAQKEMTASGKQKDRLATLLGLTLLHWDVKCTVMEFGIPQHLGLAQVINIIFGAEWSLYSDLLILSSFTHLPLQIKLMQTYKTRLFRKTDCQTCNQNQFLLLTWILDSDKVFKLP